jgi:zinc protease
MGREQAHVMVGGFGYRVTDSDRMIGRMLSNVLGGQSGRLFLELREKKSLAYTVSPTQTEGLERWSFGTYIGCANNKVNEAVEGIKSVLESLAKKGPSASEMKRAQEFYLGRRAMDLQGDAAVAASLGLDHLYGVPYQTDEALAKQVRAVRAEDVKRACQTMLCQSPQVTSLIL